LKITVQFDSLKLFGYSLVLLVQLLISLIIRSNWKRQNNGMWKYIEQFVFNGTCMGYDVPLW